MAKQFENEHDVFLPPQSSRPTRPPRHLDSSHDLLGRFALIPAYDTYVRPYVRPVPGTGPALDKGKAKEGDAGAGPADGLDAASHRIPHGLKTFLSDLPGRTSTKKSESLHDLMMQAPKQRIDIAPFDPRTLENFRLPDGYRSPNVYGNAQPAQHGQHAHAHTGQAHAHPGQGPHPGHPLDDSRKKKKRPREDSQGGAHPPPRPHPNLPAGASPRANPVNANPGFHPLPPRPQ